MKKLILISLLFLYGCDGSGPTVNLPATTSCDNFRTGTYYMYDTWHHKWSSFPEPTMICVVNDFSMERPK